MILAQKTGKETDPKKIRGGKGCEDKLPTIGEDELNPLQWAELLRAL